MKEIQDQIFIKAGDLPGDGDFFNLPGDLTALVQSNGSNTSFAHKMSEFGLL